MHQTCSRFALALGGGPRAPSDGGAAGGAEDLGRREPPCPWAPGYFLAGALKRPGIPADQGSDLVES